MADYIFDNWKQQMADFQACVQKSLEEIHQQKSAVQQMKAEILERLETGRFYRDEQRIVLSAPEIIIGNVDKSGELLGNTGRVVVKGCSVALEGVGDTGQIVSRAPSIQQLAVNPGSDGLENVVGNISEIVSHGCEIVLQSDNTIGAFSQQATSAGRGGIRIHADRSLQMDASYASAGHIKAIDNAVASLSNQISSLESKASEKKSTVDKCYDDLKKLYDQEEKLNNPEDFQSRVNLMDITDVHDSIDKVMSLLFHATMEFIQTVSQLAEANRVKKAYEDEKKRIPTGEDYKKYTTNALMSVVAETINVATMDGDGNLHTNPSAGINVRTPRMGINMLDDTGMLTPGSTLSVNTENVSLSTLNSAKKDKVFPAVGRISLLSKDIMLASKDYALTNKGGEVVEKKLADNGNITIEAKSINVSTASPANQEYDDKGKLKKAELKAEGNLMVNSKHVTVASMDYEYENGKMKQKAQTAGSTLSVRTESTAILSADVEGKAAGSISLNAKSVAVKSMDIDKEKLTDSALAAGGTMTLVSEKMYVGSKSKSIKSKKVQVVSEEAGLFADKTLEAQQGDGKAIVQLADGQAAISGSKTQIYGATTINAATEVKGEVKAPKATIDNLEAKTSFKSTNISDGIAVPAAGASSSLSAKLKTEDAPADK